MARLRRVTNKIFGKNASPTGDASVGAYIGQFGSGKAGTYIGTGDIATIQALPAWDNGWIDAVIPNQQYPCLPEMTGFGKVLSYQIGYIQQEGICEWDSATEYCKNSIVKYVPTTITYSASASIGASTGITGASVVTNTFITQITADGNHVFTYDSSVWKYNNLSVTLSDYGITYTGTPAEDDTIIITLTSTENRGDSTLYISLTDSNTGNNPSSDTVNWLLYSSGANRDLSNLSPTGQAIIDGKVNKSGDTMTGTLQFDKSLDGTLYNTNPNMLMHLNYTIDANALPANHIYGNGRVMVDNANKQCFREYDRYSTGGTYTHNIVVTNYDTQGTAHNAALSLSVNREGNTNFSFPMSDTPATTISTAANSKVAVITKNYKNGDSWYRIWSDGWKEQGGQLSNVSSDQVISLLQNFSDTNYGVYITTYASSTSAAYPVMLKSGSLTTSSFAILKREPVTEGIMWYACGY